MSAAETRSAVAIGGGTGLPQVLRSLVSMGFSTSAVVTMADDGGSSGVLRRELGILPPGDVRNCLVALADHDDETLAQVFQYRFSEGEGLAGHALGNLILAALTDITGDFSAAVRVAENYLHVRGRVLPSTLADVVLHGLDREGREIFGQARLANNPVAVDRVFLDPSDPPAHAPALDAIRDADVIIIGPGSLYTSIIPNFLVGGVAQVVRESVGVRVYVCNVANLRGETTGLDAADHVDALVAHGLEGAIDIAILDDTDGDVSRVCENPAREDGVLAGRQAIERITALGIEVHVADLADCIDPARHNRARLESILKEVLG